MRSVDTGMAVWDREEHESDTARRAEEMQNQSPEDAQQERQMDEGSSRTGESLTGIKTSLAGNYGIKSSNDQVERWLGFER